MKRRVTGLVGALVLASAGTFVLANYVESAKDRAVAGEQLVDALVVSLPVAAGTAAADLKESVKTVQVPAKVRAHGAADTLEDLEGLEAGVDLVPGEQVITSRFVRPGSRGAGLAGIPEDKLLVTVSLDPERAMGGQLKPGDTVGVLASFEPFERGNGLPKTSNSTNLILHKVPVAAVQADSGVGGSTNVKLAGSSGNDGDEENEGPAPAPTGKLLVTLALDAPSVERVVFAAEHGFVWLSAEPADAPEGGTKVVTRGNVYGEDEPA